MDQEFGLTGFQIILILNMHPYTLAQAQIELYFQKGRPILHTARALGVAALASFSAQHGTGWNRPLAREGKLVRRVIDFTHCFPRFVAYPRRGNLE